MIQFYYRAMAEESGKPKVGRSARLLGIRPGIDIDIEQMPRDSLDEQGYLLPEAERKSTGELVTVAIKEYQRNVYFCVYRKFTSIPQT